jgi:hypothetical protein
LTQVALVKFPRLEQSLLVELALLQQKNYVADRTE